MKAWGMRWITTPIVVRDALKALAAPARPRARDAADTRNGEARHETSG